MKKSILILLTAVPIFVGYIFNWTALLPVIGSIAFYALPLLVLVFWFWLGKRYSETDWGFVPSLLIGNALGIVSLGLYLWQFLIESDETRSMAIAVFSQMFSAGTPTYLFGRLAMMFESQPNYAGRITLVAIQVIALIVMMVIFTVGYFMGKKRLTERK